MAIVPVLVRVLLYLLSNRSYLYEYGASMSRIVLVWYECIINLLTKRAEPLGGLPEALPGLNVPLLL